MRVQNNPRNWGVSHNKQTSRPVKPASLSDLQLVLATFTEQLENAETEFKAKMARRMIALTEAQIAELQGAA